MTGNFCSKCGNNLNQIRANSNLETNNSKAKSAARPGSTYGQTFTEAVSVCFRKYADFSGRASRSEYWWFALFNTLLYLTVLLLAVMSATVLAGMFFYLALLGLLIPNLSVTFRRLHDAGHPGTYFLFNFIPLVGPIIMLIFALQQSETWDNEYGLGPNTN